MEAGTNLMRIEALLFNSLPLARVIIVWQSQISQRAAGLLKPHRLHSESEAGLIGLTADTQKPNLMV